MLLWLKQRYKLLILGLLVSVVTLAVVGTCASGFFLYSHRVTAASYSARVALPSVSLFSFVTLSKSSTIEVWKSSLQLLILSDKIYTDFQEQPSATLSLKLLAPYNQDLKPILGHLLKHTPHSSLAKHLIDPVILATMSEIEPEFDHIFSYLETISTGQHTWLLLFQNSEELRPTGGFLGSYALVQLHEGTLADIVIEDIYDADGQFTGFIAAPAGVDLYLSGDTGLRLPNANWSPDFPTSAQSVMQFFALGNRQSLDGVIALNLETIENTLKLVEPLWLPDYQVSVSSTNLSTVLREERNDFFPGSQDKKQLLRHVWNQLKLQLLTSDLELKQRLVKILLQEFVTKNIQVFAVDPNLQTSLQHLGIGGGFSAQTSTFLNTNNHCQTKTYPTCPTDVFSFIESNVGINKANRNIARSFSLDLEEYRSFASITFTNHNHVPTPEELAQRKTPGSDHNTYVNYLRFFVPSDYTARQIIVNGDVITAVDDTVITQSTGETFRQIGFLVTVFEQQTVTVDLELAHPYRGNTDPRIIKLIKQSGVAPYSTSVTRDSKQEQFLLEKDTLVEM